MRTNVRARNTRRTHEGAPAHAINPEQELRRSVMSCMLWEREFYEDGVSIADRIAGLIIYVKPEKVAAIAVEARQKMHLRHVPLLIARVMASLATCRPYVADTLEKIIQRPDELTEFLSLYWLSGKIPLAAQVKKGLARAFEKFDSYQLAKYDRAGKIKLRDVMFLCHPKPNDTEGKPFHIVQVKGHEVFRHDVDNGQGKDWKQLVDGKLSPPDTWEVALSSGKDKKTEWTRLLKERRLGGMALLRNLRNMIQAGVDETLVKTALVSMKPTRILPFRFIAAAIHAPRFEPQLETAMLKCIKDDELFPGKTILLVDVSGSMVGTKISEKSVLDRLDAAAGLAIMAREMCEMPRLYAFSEELWELPTRRGFAIRDVLNALAHCSTYLGGAIKRVEELEGEYDRIIVITDEQAHDQVPPPAGRGYMINVASYRNGVGYGRWVHLDGFSEQIMKWIIAYELMKRGQSWD